MKYYGFKPDSIEDDAKSIIYLHVFIYCACGVYIRIALIPNIINSTIIGVKTK